MAAPIARATADPAELDPRESDLSESQRRMVDKRLSLAIPPARVAGDPIGEPRPTSVFRAARTSAARSSTAKRFTGGGGVPSVPTYYSRGGGAIQPVSERDARLARIKACEPQHGNRAI